MVEVLDIVVEELCIAVGELDSYFGELDSCLGWEQVLVQEQGRVVDSFCNFPFVVERKLGRSIFRRMNRLHRSFC